MESPRWGYGVLALSKRTSGFRLCGQAAQQLSINSRIPPPTWSIDPDSLRNKATTLRKVESLPDLARRALIDIDSLSEDSLKVLQKDLDQMMQMLDRVQSWQETQPETCDSSEASFLYDIPRFGKVPESSVQNSVSEVDPKLAESRRAVWDSYLRPQTEQVGAHEYFVVATSTTELLENVEQKIDRHDDF
jgi:hypothetical protein